MPIDKPGPEAIPPEAGQRMRVDPSGEVHGSGAGDGGGLQGEDYSDDAGGSEAPPSGRDEPIDEAPAPDGLGPTGGDSGPDAGPGPT